MSTGLICGAGPVGLAAALFLKKRGIDCRIIDKAESPSLHSKALAVSPRSLHLLQGTGVTERMLASGKRIAGGQLHRHGKIVFQPTLKEIESEYPFMLALSQGRSEALLAEAFLQLGGTIERGVELTDVISSDPVKVTLQPVGASDSTETLKVPWLFAADGAHSLIRSKLNIPFPGDQRARSWHLVDVMLETDLTEDRAHIFLLDEGFLFVMRVVEDEPAERTRPALWRIMGNMEDPLSHFQWGQPSGPPVWVSRFHISHRIASQLAVGKIYLAGDAAHLHSPMGARGMNMGIEDAWVFAKCCAEGTLDQYHHLRHPLDFQMVSRVRMATRVACAETFWTRQIRNHLLPKVASIPAIRHKAMRLVSGLDHQVD